MLSDHTLRYVRALALLAPLSSGCASAVYPSDGAVADVTDASACPANAAFGQPCAEVAQTCGPYMSPCAPHGVTCVCSTPHQWNCSPGCRTGPLPLPEMH